MAMLLHCYLCGIPTVCEKVHDTIRYGMEPRPYRCTQCGLTFLEPKTTSETFYREDYRANYEHQNPQDIWDASIPESIVRKERFVDFLTKNTNVLEIGCSTGYLLTMLTSSVKSVMGIELTKECVEFARAKGLTVKESLAEVPDNTYDLIFMFHVLEHLDDPIEYLKEVKKKLTVNGKLIIEVPNVDDILVSTYKIPNHMDYYWEIAHNWYFSYTTLSTILIAAGYHYQIFPLQRYDLSNHMRWMQTGKPGGQGYYSDKFPPALLDEYAKTLKARWLCDTMYVIANKEEKNAEPKQV